MPTTPRLTNLQVTQADGWATPTGILLSPATNADRKIQTVARSAEIILNEDGAPQDFVVQIPPIVLDLAQTPTTFDIEFFACWRPNQTFLDAGSNPTTVVANPGPLLAQLDPSGSAVLLEGGGATVEGAEGGNFAYSPVGLTDQPLYRIRYSWTLTGVDTASALRAVLAAGSIVTFDRNLGDVSSAPVSSGVGLTLEVGAFFVSVGFDGNPGQSSAGVLSLISFMESEGFDAFGGQFPDFTNGKRFPVR